MSRLRAQKTTRKIFRLPLAVDEAETLLRESVKYQVAYRGMRYIDDNIHAIRSVAEWLVSGTTPGLLIFGEVGNGKTTLMTAVTDMLNVMRYGRDNEGKETFIYQAEAAKIAALAKDEDVRLMEWYKRPMVAIDDLGAEPTNIHIYGNEVLPMVDLLAYRYKYQLFTIATTNLKPSEIRKNYGDRIADRMKEMMTKVIIDRGSYR